MQRTTYTKLVEFKKKLSYSFMASTCAGFFSLSSVCASEVEALTKEPGFQSYLNLETVQSSAEFTAARGKALESRIGERLFSKRKAIPPILVSSILLLDSEDKDSAGTKILAGVIIGVACSAMWTFSEYIYDKITMKPEDLLKYTGEEELSKLVQAYKATTKAPSPVRQSSIPHEVVTSEIKIYIWNPFPILGGTLSGGHASILVGPEYLSFSKGSSHSYEEDDPENTNVSNIFILDARQFKIQEMQAKIRNLRAQTHQYNLFSKNCAYTVAEVLRAGGMTTLGNIYSHVGTSTVTPYRLRDDLIKQFARDGSSVLTVKALGKTERNALLKLKDKSGFKLEHEGVRRRTYLVISKAPGQSS